MFSTPDGLPTLSRGSHAEGSGFACIMEYVSVLAGEQWSDHPQCTNPYISAVARELNDHLMDEDRHLLVPLIGRLLEAHVTRKDEYTDRQVTNYLLSWGLNTWGHDVRATFHLHHGPAAKRVECMTMLLDEFDRLLGRDRAEPVPVQRLQKAAALVAR
jgi:hypothetical protein